jgi:oligopeptidase B
MKNSSSKRTYLYYGMAISLVIFSCTKTEMVEDVNKPAPPVAEKVEKLLVANGDTRVDNYYWMKLTDDQKNAVDRDEQTEKVISYLEAENNYTDEVLAHTDDLQKELFDEIVGRIKQTDESVPYESNGYWYYSRYEEGNEYPIYCRKQGNLEAEEEIMVNVNEMADGHEYYQLSALRVSPDNKTLAFAVDTVSRRRYTIYFKDLQSGEIMETTIPNTSGGAVWAMDNKTVFYTTKDPVTLLQNKIFKHKVGTDMQNDVLIYEEKDDTFYTGIYRTKSDKYLIIWAGSTLTNYYQILEADSPDGQFREFHPRERGLEYGIDHYENKFYVTTNWDALNFRLMETAENATGKENWKEVLPHRNDVLLSGVEVFKNWLVVSERTNGLRQLRIINQQSKEEHYLDFGEEAYTAYVSTNRVYDSEILRYGYTSMTTPNSTYDYDMASHEKELKKQQEVVGGYNSDDYITERLYAEARDGTEVPISLVYKKGLEKNGNNPLLLYGYGSYGATMDPSFSSVRLSLLDRGFVYAIAHIRGGQTLGRQWYEDGKMYKKKNTFTDFIDCGEHLIAENFTNTDKLFAMGGSAGGLLMGAVVNMRPDMWKGVVAAVPFVDVITTMLDESIPLTTGEYDEWGNPNELESYEYMKSYSPYDQVTAQDYPNMLVTTGLHDSQVQYWEPAKWVAKLRALKTDDNILLLETNMDAGHGGASGRFERYKITALEYAFFIDLANDETLGSD